MTDLIKYRGFATWFLLLVVTLANCKKDLTKDEIIRYSGSKGITYDIDSNGYETFGVGDQIWMSQNLRTSRLNNGIKINLVTENNQWITLNQPGYCWYKNDSIENEKFGALYNYFTIESGLLCPVGWHVPTQEDWNYLINGFGGINVAGDVLKGRNPTLAHVIQWGPHSFANPPAFRALPGGYRDALSKRQFISIDTGAYWWTMKSYGDTRYYATSILALDSTVYSKYFSRKDGLSIRCVKNK